MEIVSAIKMPPALLKLQTWFDGMEPRKRMLMLAVGVLFLAMIWQNLLWLPHQQRLLALRANLAELQKGVPELAARVQRTATHKVVDLNSERLVSIQAMETELQTLSHTLGREAGALIQPADMLKALRRLLSERSELRLRRLEASSVQPVQLAPVASTAKKEKPAEAQAQTPVIYRHDIILEIDAGYLDILAFFKEVEGYPWVFFWDEVRYHALEYPKTRATLRLFTLSMGEGLIGG
ncbi:MAG: type II secretion system protein M [Magnetococcus sp. MYC-9]